MRRTAAYAMHDSAAADCPLPLSITMDSDDEAYILLLLSDGNLPTGSFVASAGLESYVTHGFFLPSPTQKDKLNLILQYIRDSLSSYAQSALPFLSEAHQVVHDQVITPVQSSFPHALNLALQNLLHLDELYESVTLNHIARRASQTQGVALLSLYSKGFSRPPIMTSGDYDEEKTEDLDSVLAAVIDKLKLCIRREDTPGHLPICWGVLTAALGLSLERSQFLHLFLFARGLLSAGVRMNVLGPYAAQQLLLHAVRPIVTAEASRCGHLRTGLKYRTSNESKLAEGFDEDILTMEGPSMTWPLGELLAARHDLQHSRIFNS